MATGILGQSAPTATTNTTVYTVPSGITATVNINIVNRNGAAATVNIALAGTDTPSNSEWIEFGTLVPGNSVLERTGIILQAGKKIVVNATTANFSVSVYGYEA